MKKTVNEAMCVMCGCTDIEACPLGCSWVLVNREQAIGVCSSCDRPEVRKKYHDALKPKGAA